MPKSTSPSTRSSSTSATLSTPSSRPSTHLTTPVSELDSQIEEGSLAPDDDDDDFADMKEPRNDQSICTKEHVMYCFDMLVDHLENKGRGVGVEPRFGNKDEKYALFVTWNTTSQLRSTRKPSLRGCIGNFSPMRLEQGLKEYALVSALEDHRFSPIKASELPHLSCNVSLLTPFQAVSDPLGWTPGVHGIHITFPYPSSSSSCNPGGRSSGRTLSATYLPEIATDQGWTREETILSAIAKAGYKGRVKVGDEVWRSLSVKVYESVKATADYGEWVDWKARAGA